MNKSVTNIIVLLGIIVTAVAGYFLFSQDTTIFLSPSTSDQQLQQLLTSSALFVERSQALSEIDIDTGIFADPVFNSLKSYSPPPDEFQIGRNNPFAPTLDSAEVSQ